MVKPISLQQIKALREQSGAGIMEAKKALTKAKGDLKKATALLAKWGAEKIAQRDDKVTNEGQIFSYIHHDGRLGSLVKLTCETDFVAKLPEFNALGKELSLQVASMEAKTPDELLKQAYVRDSSKTIADLVNETAAKVKEKIIVAELVRISL